MSDYINIKPAKKIEAMKILEILARLYPEANCELNYSSPFELLIATMLSAQSTDKKVNQITARLFERYKTPEQFLSLTNEELENEIKQIGLYRNKSKNIFKVCRILVSEYEGKVPDNRDLLESLPGVGRKTANVVLSNAFHMPAIAVDTHVFRVSNRIGLTNSDKVLDTEMQLMSLFPKDLWITTHHLLIWHGRRICNARNPKCVECEISPYCKYGIKNII